MKHVEIRQVTQNRPCQCGSPEEPMATFELAEVEIVHRVDPDRGLVTEQTVLRQAFFGDRCIKVVKLRVRDGEIASAFNYAG